MHRLLATLAALAQAIGIQPGPDLTTFGEPSAVGLFEQQDLFVSGQAGVHTFRVPALCATTAGTLLAVCDARRDAASNLPGDIDLVLRRSTDLGATWGPLTYIQDRPDGHGVGDASLLVDRTTGRVFCFFTYAPPGIGWSNSQAGSNSSLDPNTLHAQLIWSDDDGLSWSPPLDLNPQIKAVSWRALAASSGVGIQTRAGRLIQPFAVRGAAGTNQARNVYSDDHGLTWQAGDRCASDVTDSEAVEASDGRIVQNMRHDLKHARYVAESFDAGISFDPEHQHPTLVDPLINAGLLVHSSVANGDPRDIWLFSSPFNTTGYAHLTVQLSYSEGQSFSTRRIVQAGPAGYSTLERLPDGSVGLLHERGEQEPFEAVSFARFDLDWLSERPSVLRANGIPRADHPNLWAWYDAGHAQTLNGAGLDQDGDPVARWNDRSGSGEHDLVRSDGDLPTLAADGANGLPAVTFDGDADLWGSAVAAGEFQTPSPGITVFLVARVDSVQGRGYLFDRASSAGGVGLRVAPNGGPHFELHVSRASNGPPVDFAIPSVPVLLGAVEVHTLAFGGSMLEHDVGGTLAVAWNFANGGLPLLQAGLVLGSDADNDEGFRGALAEVLVYDELLPESDRAALEGYLLGKYVP